MNESRKTISSDQIFIWLLFVLMFFAKDDAMILISEDNNIRY